MQPTMVPEEELDRRPPANHQAQDADGHAPALVGTSELVTQASAGEQGAWDQLVERYGGLVWAVARAHGLGLADAGEVSQVTWLLLTQHLGALQQPERLGSWLLRTATREAYRMGRLRGWEAPIASGHNLEHPQRPPWSAELRSGRQVRTRTRRALSGRSAAPTPR
jgi:DNA-directed RNA polymerase specialized sigma24 family protein